MTLRREDDVGLLRRRCHPGLIDDAGRRSACRQPCRCIFTPRPFALTPRRCRWAAMPFLGKAEHFHYAAETLFRRNTEPPTLSRKIFRNIYVNITWRHYAGIIAAIDGATFRHFAASH